MVTLTIADGVSQEQPDRQRHVPSSGREDISYAGAQFADGALPRDGTSGQLRSMVTTTLAEPRVVLDPSAPTCGNRDKEQASISEVNNALSEISQLQLAEEEVPEQLGKL